MRIAIRCQGWTLLELLITVAIVVVITAIASPMLSSYYSGQELQSLNTLFRDGLIQARKKAYISRKTLTYCALDQSLKCSNDWSLGNLAVFEDSNNNQTWDHGEMLYKRHSFSSTQYRICFKRGSGCSRFLKTKADGKFNYIGSIMFCDQQNSGNKLVLSMSGRMRFETATASNCGF